MHHSEERLCGFLRMSNLDREHTRFRDRLQEKARRHPGAHSHLTGLQDDVLLSSPSFELQLCSIGDKTHVLPPSITYPYQTFHHPDNRYKLLLRIFRFMNRPPFCEQ